MTDCKPLLAIGELLESRGLPELLIVTRFQNCVFTKQKQFTRNLILLALWNKVGPTHPISHINCCICVDEKTFSFGRRAPIPHGRKMLTLLRFPQKKQPRWLGEGKYWGLLHTKIQRGKWKYDLFLTEKAEYIKTHS